MGSVTSGEGKKKKTDEEDAKLLDLLKTMNADQNPPDDDDEELDEPERDEQEHPEDEGACDGGFWSSREICTGDLGLPCFLIAIEKLSAFESTKMSRGAFKSPKFRLKSISP